LPRQRRLRESRRRPRRRRAGGGPRNHRRAGVIAEGCGHPPPHCGLRRSRTPRRDPKRVTARRPRARSRRARLQPPDRPASECDGSAGGRRSDRSAARRRVPGGDFRVIEQLQRLLSDQSPFAREFGFEVISAGDGKCSIRVPYNPRMDRPDGIVSGVVTMTSADVAMWLAIKTIRGIDDNSVTTHMETHFFQSARQDAILCRAEVVKSGRRLSFGIARCTNEAGDLLTYHTLTYTAR